MRSLEDFIAECVKDTGVSASEEEFVEAFCTRCLNPVCRRSKINSLKWQQRMDRQVRALNDPRFADPEKPEWRPYALQDFETYGERRFMISPWEEGDLKPLERPPEAVESAEREAAGATPILDPNPSSEQQVPSSKRIVHDGVIPEQKHESARISSSAERLAISRGKKQALAPAPQRESAARQEKDIFKEGPTIPLTDGNMPYNTKVPREGIMLEGAPEPDSDPQQNPNQDPWSVGKDKGKVVVRFGKKDSD